MAIDSTSGPQAQPTDGIRAKPKKITPDIERTRVWTELWHKLDDRLLCAPFFAFLLVLMVLGAAIWFQVVKSDTKEIMEFWKLILPVVTLYVGYAIGKGQDTE